MEKIKIDKQEKIKRIIDSSHYTENFFKDETPEIQKKLKNWGNIYYFLVKVLGPVFVHPMNYKMLKSCLDRYNQEHTVLNIGSGPQVMLGRKDIINLDISSYEEVDIVVRSEVLPIQEKCVDFIVCVAVLEHVKNPIFLVDEIYRCLKVGGQALIFVPFMQPYHAAPDDYTRWTQNGLRELHRRFQLKQQWIGGGPTSGFLWVFQEWLAMLLSLGIRPLYLILFYMIMCVTAPLKLLDLLLLYHPAAEKIASGFYILVEKEK